jgi:hypothetical protein
MSLDALVCRKPDFKSYGKYIMQLSIIKKIHRYAWVACAGVLTLNLTSCDQRFSADAVTTGMCESPGGGTTAPGSFARKKDLALLIDVKSALIKEPVLKTFSIDVGVLSGVVTLYGAVDTPAHRDRAAQIAQNVSGVHTVKTGIAVTRNS